MSDPAFPDVDMQALNKALDRTKSSVFIGSTSAFLASVMCSLRFIWDRSIATAGTDGVSYWWNPDYFLKLPVKSRPTEIKHELWHVAKLHMLRRGNRDPKIWNIACDINIDLDLFHERDQRGIQINSWEGIESVLTWPDLDAHQYKDWVEEDIYDDLITKAYPAPTDYIPDMKECTDPNIKAKTINIVVKAMQQAKLAGNMPGDIEQMLTEFLTPIVPWEQLLHRFMSELQDYSYTWRKRNRRHSTIYLPSRFEDDGALAHLAYFEDTSGSISDEDARRFNSEFKYVKETFSPKKMTLIQFDTKIQHEQEYLEDAPFEQVKIYGRGGTDLTPVRDWIIKHKPSAAVIFSDLCCSPMEDLDFQIPIIWVCISNKHATVPFGTITHIG